MEDHNTVGSKWFRRNGTQLRRLGTPNGCTVTSDGCACFLVKWMLRRLMCFIGFLLKKFHDVCKWVWGSTDQCVCVEFSPLPRVLCGGWLKKKMCWSGGAARCVHWNRNSSASAAGRRWGEEAREGRSAGNITKRTADSLRNDKWQTCINKATCHARRHPPLLLYRPRARPPGDTLQTMARGEGLIGPKACPR